MPDGIDAPQPGNQALRQDHERFQAHAVPLGQALDLAKAPATRPAVRGEAKGGSMSTLPPASSRRSRVPSAIENLLVHAVREVQLLAALTPVEAQKERARLVAELRNGRRASPCWMYAPVSHDELRRALDVAECALLRLSEPEHGLYLARVRELSLEAS